MKLYAIINVGLWGARIISQKNPIIIGDMVSFGRGIRVHRNDCFDSFSAASKALKEEEAESRAEERFTEGNSSDI